MPRPRFYKLTEGKRTHILEAAAKEFAAHGYQNASLNRILEEANISKGAAYYYFDDKADIYRTVLLHYMEEVIAAVAFDPDHLNAENFWTEIAALYLKQFTHYYQRPWVLGITKAARSITVDSLEDSPMATIWESAQGLLSQLVLRGKELGVIRDDLPDDLLQELMIAVDTAHDRWLFDRWDEMSSKDIELAAQRIAEILKRLLEPTYA